MPPHQTSEKRSASGARRQPHVVSKSEGLLTQPATPMTTLSFTSPPARCRIGTGSSAAAVSAAGATGPPSSLPPPPLPNQRCQVEGGGGASSAAAASSPPLLPALALQERAAASDRTLPLPLTPPPSPPPSRCPWSPSSAAAAAATAAACCSCKLATGRSAAAASPPLPLARLPADGCSRCNASAGGCSSRKPNSATSPVRCAMRVPKVAAPAPPMVAGAGRESGERGNRPADGHAGAGPEWRQRPHKGRGGRQ